MNGFLIRFLNLLTNSAILEECRAFLCPFEFLANILFAGQFILVVLRDVLLCRGGWLSLWWFGRHWFFGCYLRERTSLRVNGWNEGI